MNLKTITSIVIAIAIILGFTTCNRTKGKTITPETDFELLDKSITEYRGTSPTVAIPSHIQEQPVTEIGYAVFQGKQLTSITIPSSVTMIWNSAFADNQLTSVTIPESVELVCHEAFINNPLTSITIGANVEIGVIPGLGMTGICFSRGFDNAYNYNGKQAGTYTFNNGEWFLAGKQMPSTPDAYYEFENGTITKYTGTETTVVIPSQIRGQAVTKIASYAFAEKQIASITIPPSVTTIEPFAFNGTSPTYITIGANVSLGARREGSKLYHNAFMDSFDDEYNNGKLAGTYMAEMGEWVFSSGVTFSADRLVTVSKVTGDIAGDHHFYADQQTKERVIFRAIESVENFAYIELKQDEEGNFIDGGTLFHLDDFTPEKPLVVSVEISEGIPTRGIVFFSRGVNNANCFYLTESGVDGSLNLFELTLMQ